MKAHTLILVVLLLLALCAVDQGSSRPGLAAQASALAQPNSPSSVQYFVMPGAASGGSYRLDSLAQPGGRASSGGKYRLLRPASPSGGTPCCCSYLPCVSKQ